MSSTEQTASSVDNLWDFLRSLLKIWQVRRRDAVGRVRDAGEEYSPTPPDEQRSGHEQREVGVRREREREPWIGRRVKARIGTRFV